MIPSFSLYVNRYIAGSVIGQLGFHDKIEVVEYVGNEQQIDNVWAYWYKIKHNNLTGYIWGGYIAIKTFVFDIDGNGINDYFHFRISDTVNVFWVLDAWKDVIIYINDIKISTDGLRKKDGSHHWMSCNFEKGQNKVIINLSSYSTMHSSHDIFEIDKNGTIRFIEHIYYGE